MSRRSRPRAHRRKLTNVTTGKGGAVPRAKNRRAELRASGSWYRIKNFVETPDTAAIYLYDEIGYWGVTAQDFVRDLMGLRVSNIVLHLNSPGGDVFDGLAIYHALRDHPATVESRVDGLAASAASFIAMAADTVVMQRNAQLMIHEASGIEIGNAEDMRAMADLLDKCSDNIADIYLQHAGGTLEQWRAAMKGETWYSAEEALAAGLADVVNNADDEPAEGTAVVPGGDQDDEAALMANSWDLSFFRYAGRDAAPAPVNSADEPPESSEPPEPEPAAEPEPEPSAVVGEDGPELVDLPEPVPTTVPAADGPEPVAEPEPPASPVDEWAAMTASLLTPIPAPSTVDELFAALQTKGLA